MRVLLIVLVFLCSYNMFAQQLSLHTQYMFNRFTLNPAFAGTSDGTPINMSVRRQWFGIKEAPVTQFLSAHTGFDKLGLGASIYNEASGPTRRTGLSFAMAYHLELKDRKVISFGLAPTLTQLGLDKNRLETHLPDDPTIAAVGSNQTMPDANFGVYFHDADKYYVSFSAYNLVQTKTDLLNIPNTVRSRFVRNYYLSAGGHIDLNRTGKIFTLQPSLLFQMIESLPFQLDLNTVAMYDEKYIFGFSYRYKDAVALILGFKKEAVRVGYSYDYTLSKINNYSSGSHEINLTYQLGRSRVSNRSF